MSTEKPNHIHLNGGVVSDHTFGAGFGSLIDCRPVNIAGIGSHPHVAAHFRFGIRLEFDRATAIEFARALTESVNALPPVVAFDRGECSGITAELGEL